MNFRTVLGIFSISLLISCSSEHQTEKVKEETDSTKVETTVVKDEHSYANTNDVKTEHLHLALEIDFDNKVIHGRATHKINNISGVSKMIFDTHDLVIEDVFLDNGEHATFKLGEIDELLGQPLEVEIKPETKKVVIVYRTTPESEALQWLNPQQTAGKKLPYLFTQGEAVLTRSWIPCQDTPSNRITYSAEVTCPSNLMAVMSATNPTEKSTEGYFRFEMNNPIPSYLIALAVGDLQFASLGNRTGVYTEPSMIDKCVEEFEDVESMVEAAEELYGQYKWGRYDIIVLPPSFPFGGMENPKLTFATPTIIAGDKSLVSLIAHELAHSWSGNLVTNATWDDFWLNEGFTVYFENRIMEKIYGKERSDMLLMIEYQELLHENDDMINSGHGEDTHLKLNLKDRNPDDGMTAIAYTKGALFLKTLEEAVGRDKFDKFLNSYFDTYQFKTVTTEDFVNYAKNNLLKPNNIEFNIDEWVYGEGIPDNCVKIESDRFKICDEKAKFLADVKTADELLIDESIWTTQEWMRFIRQIPENTTIEKMKMLDDAFNLSDRGNAEIMSEWYIKSIKIGYKDINEPMEQFLIEVGRRKFLAPIYTELAKTSENLKLAKKIYKKARPNYHAISFNTIDEILGWSE
ncbi:MAG TPA: M1 family peptidase [Crocinitomix sp.]|nr:M1 family peptidase [Crocinitomix sp.]